MRRFDNTMTSREQPILITGGAGFIGTNLAHRLLSSGSSVLIFDNLSRPGVDKNLRWLRQVHGNRVQATIGDIRDPQALHDAVMNSGQVFHLAAQVAVTTSLNDPVEDFQINVGGTLNLLEALRTLKSPPPLVFTSTNKVYGNLQNIELRKNATHYEPVDSVIRLTGISEDCPLDFHSPYGCSKGAADQYVIDYARSYGLPAVVFRMSCIYGPHQFGTEDQGWVAHFLIRTLKNEPITFYGDGLQVRDILFVQDLVDALLLAQENMAALTGQSYNIGGGSSNRISLLELTDVITELHGKKPSILFSDWRNGDQKYYVSDTHKFEDSTGWSPKVPFREGIEKLYEWLVQSDVASPPEEGEREKEKGEKVSAV